MAVSIDVEFDGMERGDPTGQASASHWQVFFTVTANNVAYSMYVWIPLSEPEDDVIKRARALIHEILQAAADHTRHWKQP